MKKLRHIVGLVIAMLMFSVAPLSGQLKGDTYEKAKSSGYATWILTYSEAPGFASGTDAGISGITIDIMEKFREYIEEKEGIKIAMKFEVDEADNFTLFLDQVRQGTGGVFGLSNTTITVERSEVYSFSPPYITNIGMLLTHSSVRTLMDLSRIATTFKEMTAVTVKNSTNEKRILAIKEQYYPDLKIEHVPSFGQVMDIIVRDRRKFAHLDFTWYFDAVQKRWPVKRHPGGDDKTEEFGIIMPKSNDWAPLLADFMNSGFVGSEEYKKIIADHLGQNAMKFLVR